MTRTEILNQAIQIISGDRDQQYGQPENNFAMVAAFWANYLGTQIGAEEVAAMMILFKVARLIGSDYKSADSWIDIAGYAACGGDLCATTI